MKFLITFFLAIPLITSGQTRISGKVSDEKGNSVPFANVFIKDSYDGATSSESGEFAFLTEETGDQVLSATSVGFLPVEVPVKIEGKDLVINLKLKSNARELNAVTITAGAFEASDEKKAVVLKPLDIVTTAGAAGDIYGALQTLPGATPVGEQEGLFVRGGSAWETKTFIDEMVVPNPFFSSVPDVPQRGRFSPFMFKGTIFSTGGYSAQYGQALSSALILNTNDLNEQRGGSVALTAVGTNLSYTLREKNTSLSASGGYVNLKPYFALQKQLTEWEREPEGVNGALSFKQRTSETGMLKVYGTYSANRSSMFFSNSPGAKDYFSLTNGNLYVNSSYKEFIAKDLQLIAGVSYTNNKDDILRSGFDLSTRSNVFSAKSFATKFLGNNSLKAGAEVIGTDNNATFNFFSGSINEVLSAGFVEGDIFITSKIAARAGARYEYSDFLRSSSLSPRASLAVKTSENGQVSFAYGQFYQNPENRYLYQQRDLDFEKASHYIANYQWIVNDRTFRIEGYYKEYDNLLLSEQRSPFTAYTNGGSGFAQGIDVFWRDRKTIKNTDYWVSYSLLNTKRFYLDYPKPAMPTFASPHTVSLVAKYWIAKVRCSVGGTYIYSSGRPYFNPNRPDSEFLVDRTPAYSNLSMNASRLTTIRGNFTVIFFSVSNILGTRNVFGYRYSADGTQRTEISPPNLRMFFIGCFVSFGQRD